MTMHGLHLALGDIAKVNGHDPNRPKMQALGVLYKAYERAQTHRYDTHCQSHTGIGRS